MPTSFTDVRGQTWTIVVNYATLVRVQGETGVDLTKICDPAASTDAELSHPVTLFRVLCAAVRPQLRERGLTDEAFGELLNEEQAEAAGLALYEAVIDFFRGPKRDALRRAFRKVIQAATAHRENATAALERMLTEPALDELIRHSIGGSFAAGSPASSESLPNR